jgi:glycosyltransferase involved in cell wall biosynthesis
MSRAPDTIRAVHGLMRRLRAAQPDLIHTNGMKAHFIGGICGPLLRLPVVWHMRDLVPEGSILRLVRAAAGLLPQRIITVSAAVAAQFMGCRAAKRVQTVHDAVDLARYRPSRTAAAVRAELGLAPDAVVLAMVAHFTRWKGHDLFLETMARLISQGVPVSGMIVGGPIYASDGHESYEAEVRQYSRTLGLEDRVFFTGYQEQVADYVNAADILVHPPTRPEPFGLAVIEAMALYKPVVAAAAGGMLETMKSEVTGLLVPPGDAGAFAQAVRTLLGDPRRRAAMGCRGHERVTERFTPELHRAGVERVYAELGV